MFILQMAQVPRFFLLPVERHVPRVTALALHVVGALDQHAPGACGRIADAHSLSGREGVPRSA